MLSQNCEELYNYIFERSYLQEKRDKKSLNYMKEFAKISKLKPHKVKIIHIAGSKGKGSLGIHIASGLVACGYKVGLYTSPHVSHWYERMQILGESMDEQCLLKIGQYLQKCVIQKNYENRYNFFEWLTALSMHYFIMKKCDFVILETGLGGTLDSTNIFYPIATAITLIEHEHCEILGDTLEKIANQKCGIIKRRVPNYSYLQKKEVTKIITNKCKSMQSQNHRITDKIKNFSSNIDVHSVDYAGETIQFKTSLLGSHQGLNALLAFYILEGILKKRFIKKKSQILDSFQYAFLKGRFQVVSRTPLIVIDSAHTVESVKASVETIQKLVSSESIYILFGCAEGKNSFGMLEILRTISNNILITRPGNFKKSDLDEIEQFAEKLKFKYNKISDTFQACKHFLNESSRCYFVVGSFFLVDIFLQAYGTERRNSENKTI